MLKKFQLVWVSRFFKKESTFIIFTLQSLGSTKRSCILKQTCNFKMQICLSMYGHLWTPGAKGVKFNMQRVLALTLTFFPITSPVTSYVQRWALCSNCKISVCEVGGSAREELRKWPPSSPALLLLVKVCERKHR